MKKNGENIEKICNICKSSIKVQYHGKYKNLLCGKHRHQYDRNGYFYEFTRFNLNEILSYDNYAEIILYDNYGTIKSDRKVIIDIEDVEKVQNHRWSFRGDYVRTIVNKKQLKLHHLIIGKPKKDKAIDHKNRNKFDNRKENLRFVNYSFNNFNKDIRSHNTSGTTGVNKLRNKWRAYININKKQIHLGIFENKEDAIKARKIGEIKYYNEKLI